MAGEIAETLGTDLADRYRFIGEIGRGGMANVYLTATRGALGGFQKLVVIKLLRADLAEEQEFRQMFLAEARLAARLNHPNVVQTYDVGEDDGRYYLAMEYVDGQTLETRAPCGGCARVSSRPRMQLQVLVHVLAGLHYAHELADYDGKPLNVVHRDVTPSNILLGYDGRVKLVDFGVAKALDSGTQTRAGVVKGKTGYMAPETFTDSGHVDRRADIYSVGVLLWETLVGRRMWKQLGSTDRLQRAIEGEIEPLRPLVPERAAEARADLPQGPAAEARGPLRHRGRAPGRPRGLPGAQSSPGERSGRSAHTLAEAFDDDRKQITSVIEHQLKNDADVKTLPDLSPQTSKLVTGVGSTMSRFSLGPAQKQAAKTAAIAPAARRRPAGGGGLDSARGWRGCCDPVRPGLPSPPASTAGASSPGRAEGARDHRHRDHDGDERRVLRPLRRSSGRG